jgi:hypothetical protein
MKSLQIYDPAMCCSTGVCGPSVDQKLAGLAADVAYFKAKGVEVERFNLGHQPEVFASNSLILSEMGSEAEHLPIFMVDGVIRAKAKYPDRAELAGWLGIDADLETAKPRKELKMAASICCEGSGESCC